MLLALISALLFQTRLTDGPGLPLAIVGNEGPYSVSLSDQWVEGYYGVTFEYRIKKTVSQVASACKEEDGVVTARSWPASSSFHMERSAGGVYQVVEARKELSTAKIVDGQLVRESVPEGVTLVHITETVLVGSQPRAFYKSAKADPPAPMLAVPFMPEIETSGACVCSFESLMSSKGRMFGDRDAVAYEAIVKEPIERIRPLLEHWANTNGYKATQNGSWFRAGTGVFEISVTSAWQGGTLVRLWSSRRKAEHPICWEKI